MKKLSGSSVRTSIKNSRHQMVSRLKEPMLKRFALIWPFIPKIFKAMVLVLIYEISLLKSRKPVSQIMTYPNRKAYWKMTVRNR